MADLRLGMLKVPVTDAARAAAFYRDHLGFEEQFVADEFGWAQMACGDVALALYEPGKGGGDGQVGGSTGFQLCAPADGFDELAERLAGAGALVGGTVHRGADGSAFVDVQDPDGNVVKVMRLAD